MAGGAQQLTVGELEERFRAAKDVVERSHCQAIWLLAKGHSTAEVAEIVALTARWVNKLARRYEADGADALGDRRRRNAGAKPLLSADDLEALRERLKAPPDDGGVWTGPEGRALDRGAARAGARACAARLGGAEADRLVDPGAASAKPQGGGARRPGGV